MNRLNKRAIVTGGAGFIGSNLVKFLLGKNWKVTVIDDFSVGKITNLPKVKNLKIVKGDIRDIKKMREEVAGANVVFHLAVQCVRKSINNPFLVHEVNAQGTLSVLDAAYRNKISGFVYVSSSEVYGTAIKVPMSESHPLNPTTVYGASKLAGEMYSLAYFRTYGYPVIIVRPFNTYGPNSHLEGPYGEVIPRFVLRSINNLPLHVFGDGRQTRDFTYLDDTVKGIWLAYKNGSLGEVYNIAHGKEVTINELAKIIVKITRSKSKIEYLFKRPGDVKQHYADTKKAGKLLDFKADIEIEDGLKLYIDWFRKNYHNSSKPLKEYEQKNW